LGCDSSACPEPIRVEPAHQGVPERPPAAMDGSRACPVTDKSGQSSAAQYHSPNIGGSSAAAGSARELEACEPRPCKVPRSSCSEPLELHPNVALTPTQKDALGRVTDGLDLDTASVVVTNPLASDNPIVFVTKQWEHMCGFSYEQAVGRNARITQGENSDPAVSRLIGSALRSQRACKVMTLNYRGGLANQPFWNMLSISPVTHSGQLVLYLANLQDYTYHMSKLVSLPPSQFCRSAEHHQRQRRLPPDTLHARFFANPSIIETNDAMAPAPAATASSSADGILPQLKMKRLGWSNLPVEPEHLTDRVVDALHSLDARYERVERTSDDDDIFVVNAEINGVAARLLVSRDPDDETSYRVTCTRLGGDTFAYHDAFRQLRQLLGDAVTGGKPLRGGSTGGLMALAPARPSLAPMPACAKLVPSADVSDASGDEATGGGHFAADAATGGGFMDT